MRSTWSRELALVNVTHDVFLVLVDSAWAFATPPISSGWITVHDVEGGEPRVISRRACLDLATQAAGWQDRVARAARDAELDVVVLGRDERQGELALAEFVAERRLRRVRR